MDHSTKVVIPADQLAIDDYVEFEAEVVVDGGDAAAEYHYSLHWGGKVVPAAQVVGGPSLTFTLPTPEQIEEHEAKEAREKLLATLSPRERRIVESIEALSPPEERPAPEETSGLKFYRVWRTAKDGSNPIEVGRLDVKLGRLELGPGGKPRRRQAPPAQGTRGAARRGRPASVPPALPEPAMSRRLDRKRRKKWRRIATLKKSIAALGGEPAFKLMMWHSMPLKQPSKPFVLADLRGEVPTPASIQAAVDKLTSATHFVRPAS